MAVRVMGGPDSIVTFVYDPRLSVVRLIDRIGDVAIRAVPETRAQPVSESADSGHSLTAAADRP